MLPGTTSERAAILRSGARMFAAQTQATTPKINVTIRKAYGFGSMVMAMMGFDHQTATFAFPGVTLGAMGAGASRARCVRSRRGGQLVPAELDASYRSPTPSASTSCSTPGRPAMCCSPPSSGPCPTARGRLGR